MSPFFSRAIVGFVIAGFIVFIARRKNALSPGGATLAVTMGTICAAAGWGWAALLITFFISANILSTYRHRLRAERINELVEKGNERDAWQVAANGGVFSLAAVASLINPSGVWLMIAAGAITAVTSDTWSTEIGTVVSSPPRLITNGKIVEAGTSGGITLAGSLAAIAGCITMAIVTLAAGWGERAAVAAIAGGMTGSIVDSLAGATIQRKQWCAHCGKLTERLVHTCGTITQPHGGVSWIGNDLVNTIASIAGAIAGLAVLR
ncbi:MAG TPA: DUF92 domain-containing protein [Gemmatimonadaceae bacterium]|nr:DUF92 domain-containing protein [Gemmatimonadaceae bacterium]